MKHGIKKVFKWSVFIILAFVIGGLVLLRLSPDYNTYLVRSESMRPVINMGDMIINGPLNAGIGPGTIVTYPHGKGLVTHRVVSIDGDTLVTKGDADEDPDPWSVTLSDVKGIYLFKIPSSSVINSLFAGTTSLNMTSVNAGFNPFLVTDYKLDASGVSSITVSFWFRPHDIETDDVLFQLYNGSTYDTLYDLADYPNSQNDAWCYFTEEITDSQYFTSDFRLRFDGSELAGNKKDCLIDDVRFTMVR